ncbi:MAG TPA: hypothetical protein VFD46_02860 [Chryseolinea sp.]|nr:hypothetical protein [Chryseolinea sp.]
MSISTIILSATVKERLEVQFKLQVFNENLEQWFWNVRAPKGMKL